MDELVDVIIIGLLIDPLKPDITETVRYDEEKPSHLIPYCPR
jgi:hypothetical protein